MDRLELEERRARNLIWTGAGRCDFTPDFLAYGGDGRALPYWNILLGAARRFYDYPKLEGFFADIETKGNSTFLVDMVWLGLENALFEKSRLIWPNLPSMRLACAEGLIQDLDATALVDYYESSGWLILRGFKPAGQNLRAAAEILEDLIITQTLTLMKSSPSSKPPSKNICIGGSNRERHRQRPKDLAHQRGFPPWQGIFPAISPAAALPEPPAQQPPARRLDCGKPIYQNPSENQQDLPGKAGGEIRPVPVDR